MTQTQTQDLSAGVTTTGQGAATAVPDVVVVELGAEATGDDVQVALDAADAGLRAAREALLAAGVAHDDLRTAQTSTWTQQSQQPDGGSSLSVTARLTLRVTVRDVPSSGELVRAALGAAGPVARLDSMRFAVSAPGPLAVAAREEAFADARTKAEQYASLAGRALGAVVEVSEQGSGLAPARACCRPRRRPTTRWPWTLA
ncbi:SIMPL domain-containing protein [Oerskovia sp. M15]